MFKIGDVIKTSNNQFMGTIIDYYKNVLIIRPMVNDHYYWEDEDSIVHIFDDTKGIERINFKTEQEKLAYIIKYIK